MNEAQRAFLTFLQMTQPAIETGSDLKASIDELWWPRLPSIDEEDC